MSLTSNDKPPSINKISGSEINIDGGDFVGRDKIIQNIIIVGEFLNMAKASELLSPMSNNVSRFASIKEAYVKVIEKRQNTQDSQALAFAGEIIGVALNKWKNANGSRPATFKKFLPELAITVVEQLNAKGCWEAACSPWAPQWTKSRFEVFWLKATMEFGKNVFQRGEKIGLALKKGNFNSPVLASFVREAYPPEPVVPSGVARVFMAGQEPAHKTLFNLDFAMMSNEEIQIIFIGLVLDLAQVYIQVTGQDRFINKLISNSDDNQTNPTNL